MSGDVLQHLLVQTPVVALLLIIMMLDRRDHAKTIDALRSDNKLLHDNIMSRIDLLISLQKRG